MADDFLLQTTGMAYGGDAVAQDLHRIIFVPYALPGEQVRVQLVEQHKRWARARLLEIVQPSPQRIAPACPHFGPGRCGGCQWQHAPVPAQLQYKQQLLQDQMAHVQTASPVAVQPTRSSSPPWAYLTQATYYPTPSGSLGLPQRHGRAIHAIDICPLQHPALAELYESFQLSWDGLQSLDMYVGISSDQSLVVLHTRGDRVPEIETDLPVSIVLQRRNGSVQPLIGEPWVFELIRGHEYRLSAGTPRSGHVAALEDLIAQVEAYLQPAPGQLLVDVYSGYGLFSRAFADQVSTVISIEEHAAAMEDCAFNCRHLDNVALAEGPPSSVLRLHKGYADIAVVSPPRQGMGHRIAQNLARLGVKRVAYVAPHPNTLLRDLPEWQKANYFLTDICPVDLGPQTADFVTVALFLR